MYSWREQAAHVGIRSNVVLVTLAVGFQVALRAWRGPTHQHSDNYVGLMLLLWGIAIFSWIVDDGFNQWIAVQLCAWGSWAVLVTLALLDVDRGQYPIILCLLAGGAAMLGTSISRGWMIVYSTLTVMALSLSAVATDEYDGATITAIVCAGAGVAGWFLGDKFERTDRVAQEANKAAQSALDGVERLSDVIALAPTD